VRIPACVVVLVTLVSAACAASGPTASSDEVGVAVVNDCVPPADTVPPAITDVSLSRRFVNLRSGAQTVRLSVHAEDRAAGAVSGVRSIKVEADGPTDERVLHLSLVRGTPDSGVWSAPIRLTRDDNSGHWYLRLFEIVDGADNGIYYIKDPGPPADVYDPRLHPGWQQTFTVTGTPTKPPDRPGHPISLSMSPRAVDSTAHAQNMDVAARFSGPVPRAVQFQLGGSGPPDSRFIGRINLTRHGKVWSGVFPVPRWVGTGTSQVILVARYRYDVRPDYRFFYPATLKRSGLPVVVRITSGRDTAKPVLSAFSFTPDAVDTTSQAQVIHIAASAIDESGITAIDVRFGYGSSKVVPVSLNPNAPQPPSPPIGTNVDAFSRLARQGDEWRGSITIPSCIHGGTWQAGVYIANRAKRSRDYDDHALRSAGFASALEVTSTPVDTDVPTITTATASAATHTISLTFDHGMRAVTPSMLTVYPSTPRATRYDQPLTIQSITCANAADPTDCDGSGGPITSATLSVPAVTQGETYEVWANLHQAIPQLIDTEGYAIDGEYGPTARATP
jgi:hypothetical protein